VAHSDPFRRISPMTSRSKVAVLGLDGVPFTLLRKLFDAGVMPRLAEVAKRSFFSPMETTLPPVSSVAWTSFMTGTGPGRHGIFGFTDLHDDSISLRFPSFDDIRSQTIWQALPQARSLVINLPFTYPARPLNGVLISGFVAPVFEKSVYPASLIPWLKSRGYKTDVDSVKGRTDRRGLIRELFDTLNVRTGVLLDLMQSRPWDLFIGVVTGTDRLHHFFFDAVGDPDHPFHRDFIDYYRRIDLFFGRFSEQIGDLTRLIVLSDHGFALLRSQVYVNHILRQMGYLSPAGPAPQSLDDVLPDSKAFALEPNRIYLNNRARFPGGPISPEEVPTVRARLKKELEGLRLQDVGIEFPEEDESPDNPIFERVLVKEEAFDGECLAVAPDLLLIPRRGYDLKAAFNAQAPSNKDIFTGAHTHDDAFLIVNDPSLSERLTRPRITDVAGLVRERLAGLEFMD